MRLIFSYFRVCASFGSLFPQKPGALNSDSHMLFGSFVRPNAVHLVTDLNEVTNHFLEAVKYVRCYHTHSQNILFIKFDHDD